MRVLALGGSGAMGRHAVHTAIADPGVAELVVADLDGVAAARAAEAAGPRARGVAVDVQDEAALERLLREADVVMNTVGPFFRFGPPILRAAIAAGCHYLDICDDWEPTLEMLSLDARARDAGVIGVIGLGASPGITNLLAARAIGELDRVDEVFTVWSLDGAASSPGEGGTGPEPSAAVVHGIHQMSGRIRTFEGGALVDQKPLQRFELEVPGVGRHPVWTIGHPESVTLPRTFRTLRRSTNACFTRPSSIAILKLITAAVDFGFASVERAARWVERLEVGEQEAPLSATAELPADRLPPLFALARGTRGGSPASAAVVLASAPEGGMGPITGVPLGLGVAMLAAGELTQTGVSAPEAAVAPGAFFARLRGYCEPVPPRPEALTVTLRSWEPGDLNEAFRSAWA